MNRHNSQWAKKKRQVLSAVLCSAMLLGSAPAAFAVEVEAAEEPSYTETEAAAVVSDTEGTEQIQQDETEVTVQTEEAVQEEETAEEVTASIQATEQLTYAAFSDGWYQFTSTADGTVLTTAGKGGADNLDIRCRSNGSLTTQVYKIRMYSDHSMRLYSATAQDKLINASSGDAVQTARQQTAAEKLYAVEEADGQYSLRSAANPEQALTNSSGDAVLAAYTGDSTQLWAITSTALHSKTIESGVYTIDSVKYSKSMAVSGDSNTANTPIVLKSKTVADAQKFYVKYVGDGKYTITAYRGNGNVLRVASDLGSSLRLGGSKIRFYIDEKSDGTYAIIRAGSCYKALTASSSSVQTANYAGKKTQGWTFDSKVTEDKSAATKSLKSVMKVYPNGTNLGSSYSFGGAYQCMGFGREVFYRVFGKTIRWDYDGSPLSSSSGNDYEIAATSTSFSSSSIKKLISKAAPGDILQMDQSKIHTMVFVSSDSDGFTIYDANWTASNQVSVRYVSYSAWSGRNSNAIRVLHSTDYPAK